MLGPSDRRRVFPMRRATSARGTLGMRRPVDRLWIAAMMTAALALLTVTAA